MDDTPTFLDEQHLRLGGHDFFCSYPLGTVPEGHLEVMKPRELVEHYIDLLDGLRPARIVELGVRGGGSTAMLSALARPEKLVAVELEPVPPEALVRYIQETGREESVRLHCGVDQADRVRLAGIVEEEFDGAPLDLVIDDASHMYDQTLASFEVLFPHVRPGGVFMIEDWRWEHLRGDNMVAALRDASEEQRAELNQKIEAAMTSGPRRTPLTRLVIALLLARASSGDAVDDICIGPHLVIVRRGPGALEPGSFRVTDLFQDHYDQL